MLRSVNMFILNEYDDDDDDDTKLDPSAEFFGDVRPANLFLRPIFDYGQHFFRQIFGLFRN